MQCPLGCLRRSLIKNRLGDVVPHINLGWAHQRLCKISVTHEIGLFQHYLPEAVIETMPSVLALSADVGGACRAYEDACV